MPAASRRLKILLIEDDGESADYVAHGLREEGHLVAQVATGTEGLISAMGNGFDLLIVDRMIPGLDGLNLVKSLRAAGHHTPVLFLTALGGVEDRVSGLNAGGDDYLVKPFAFSELVARVAALGRRPRTTAAETRLHVLDLELDLLARTVRRRGQLIELQPREFPIARIPDAARWPGRHPYDATRARLGHSFRPADERCRNPHQPAAHQDRQRL